MSNSSASLDNILFMWLKIEDMVVPVIMTKAKYDSPAIHRNVMNRSRFIFCDGVKVGLVVEIFRQSVINLSCCILSMRVLGTGGTYWQIP